jgi:hypothetical protein
VTILYVIDDRIQSYVKKGKEMNCHRRMGQRPENLRRMEGLPGNK